MQAEPRLAATVMLARDGRAGLEVFLVRRHERSHALPSVYVFPGGTVRDDDFAGPAVPPETVRTFRARSDQPPAASTAGALFRCALRELFEEAGVLLVTQARGGAAPRRSGAASADALAAERVLLQRGARTLGRLLRRVGRRPAFDELVPFSHWVTPEGVPARYDTWFFVAAMPDHQEALHCAIETTDGAWVSPRDALDGAFPIVYPTAMHLGALAVHAGAAALLAHARAKPIPRVQPGWVGDAAGRRPEIPPQLVGAW